MNADDGSGGRKKTFGLPEKERKRIESLLWRIEGGLQLQLSLVGKSVELIEKREKAADFKGNRKRKLQQNKKEKKGTNKVSAKIKKCKIVGDVKKVVDQRQVSSGK